MSNRNPIEIRNNVEKMITSIVNEQTTEFTDIPTFTDLIKKGVKELGADVELNVKMPLIKNTKGKIHVFKIDFVCGVPGVTRFALVTKYEKKTFTILDRVFW